MTMMTIAPAMGQSVSAASQGSSGGLTPQQAQLLAGRLQSGGGSAFRPIAQPTSFQVGALPQQQFPVQELLRLLQQRR